MGHIGNEIRAHGLNAAQLRHHLIKIQKHEVQIVVAVGGVEGRDIDGKIPVGHLVRRLGQLLHGLVIGLCDLVPGKQRQPHRHQRPVGGGDQDLHGGVPVGIFIDQGDKPDVDAGHQKQRHQVKSKQGRRKPGLQPSSRPRLHFSTAL